MPRFLAQLDDAVLNSKIWLETWSSAITGLAVFLASSSLGVVEEHTTMGPIVWLLLLIGSVSLGIAVWMMGSMAQRMGPPYCD